MIRFLRPDRLWARFALLLLVAMVSANLIAAFLIAREGTLLDQIVRVERDLGRLVALTETLEEVDEPSGRAILERSGTGYTRFSVDPEAIIPHDAKMLRDLTERIAQVLPDHQVRAVASTPNAMGPRGMPLLILSVQLAGGPHDGKWLNSLVYPLTASVAWGWKAGFFIPLAVSLVGSLAVGLWFTRRMTAPLRGLADAAKAAGSGNRFRRLPETGAMELREVASAFNDMQQQIFDFDVARQQMLAAIGHDLRTPITSLRLRASLISDVEMRPDMIRILDEMAVMAQDLVAYARSSDSSETPERLDLEPLVARLCAEGGAKLIASEPAMMTVRPVAISRAITNVVGNAMRYAGGADVTLRRTAGQVVISVADRGPGLPEEALGRMTQPFVRHETSRNPETGGTGLGLAITEKILRDHGGSLSLRNREGGGLVAEMVLPFR